MFRCVIVLLALAVAGSARAQERKPGDPVPLLLSGSKGPVPSLKYRLAHDRREMVPGNAATLYYRTYGFFSENRALLTEIKELHWSEWAEMPLNELPREEIRQKLQEARHVLHELDLAGRRRDCDWQLDGRDEGISLLLPEVQSRRNFAAVLAVKARLEMAEGHFADALATLRCGLALGKNIAKGPTLIHVLVGVAVNQVMLNQLEQLIQQPDAPNLYWALTVLPQPFIDPRKAVLEESEFLEHSLPFLKRLNAGPLTLTEVHDAVVEIRKMQSDFNLKPGNPAETLAQAAYIEASQKEAKQTLIKKGLNPQAVEAMPSFQAVSLLAYREFRETREEVLKWVFVTEGRKHPAFQEAVQRHNRSAKRLDLLFFRGIIFGLGGLGTLSFETVFHAANRLDRRLAAIRGVEALRLHAAAHGSWPAKLDDIKDVPMPVDPLTRKPFEYRFRNADHAVVATPSSGENERPDMKYVFHMALRK